MSTFTAVVTFCFRYSEQLGSARKIEITKGALSGFFLGLFNFFFLSSYGLILWYGTLLVLDEEITIGQVTVAFTGILVTADCFGKVSTIIRNGKALFMN